MDERGRLAMLTGMFASAAAEVAGVEVAIGDDAAVLAWPEGGRAVWTIDEQVEGTHFRREWLSWRDVGWRSFMAAASDLAAMGAVPWCALSALVLPAGLTDAALEEIAAGQRAAAETLGAPVVGGNLARGECLSIATTLLGRCDRPVLRRGARPGDSLWVAGRLGISAAGMRALERGRAGETVLAPAVAAWRRPSALVAAGRAMATSARAAIDVSDGLARDVGHVAEASGVQVVLDEDALVGDAELISAAAALGEAPVGLALHGGEDYALVAVAPGPIEGFRRLGEVAAGSGVILRGATGERPVEPRGFDHFES